jgi:hypothetical protein
MLNSEMIGLLLCVVSCWWLLRRSRKPFSFNMQTGWFLLTAFSDLGSCSTSTATSFENRANTLWSKSRRCVVKTEIDPNTSLVILGPFSAQPSGVAFFNICIVVPISNASAEPHPVACYLFHARVQQCLRIQ